MRREETTSEITYTPIREDSLHQADNLTLKLDPFRRACRRNLGSLGSVIIRQRGVIIRIAMEDHRSRDDEGKDVEPNSSMCQPAQPTQRPYLTQKSPCDSPNEAQDDKADRTVTDLGQTLSVLDDEDSYVEE